MTVRKRDTNKQNRNGDITNSQTVILNSNYINNTGGGVEVVDNLNSLNTVAALSANLGRILKSYTDFNKANIDVVNLSALTNDNFYGIGYAVDWLVKNADKYNIKLHLGMGIKYRDYVTGKWYTFLYKGGSDWKSENYSYTSYWVLHINEEPIQIVNNLTSTSKDSALSAYQGKLLNDNKLSRMMNDVAYGQISFNKGLITDEWKTLNFALNISGSALYREQGYDKIESGIFQGRQFIEAPDMYIDSSISSNDYAEDTSGFSITNEYGPDWLLVIDNLKVRKHLTVNSLTIDEAKYIGGKLYCTKAGLTISKVKKYDYWYRCYFETKDSDGNIINNLFAAHDLAFCLTFNNNNVKRWWRMIHAVGENYIDVSDLDDKKESGSSVPEVGDVVVQLGNMNDTTRQGALVIQPLSIDIYNGIHTFKLPAPEIRFSPTDSKIDADKINFIGKTIINDNFIVDEKGNITINDATIKGNIRFKMREISNSNLSQYFDTTALGTTVNLEKSGYLFKFVGDFDVGFKVQLPAYLPKSIEATEEQKDILRAQVMNKLVIYNNSPKWINIYFPQSSSGIWSNQSISLKTNQWIVLEGKIVYGQYLKGQMSEIITWEGTPQGPLNA